MKLPTPDDRAEMNMAPPEGTRHILWTGGWDSSFAVIAVLASGAIVRPYYVRDPGRRSTEYELAAIAAISKKIGQVMGAEVRARLLDIAFIDIESIHPDPDIAAKLARLRKTKKFGSQYDWLMPLAAQMSDVMLEMSSEARLDDTQSTSYALRNDITKEGYGGRIKASLSNPDLEVYRPFYLPVIHLSKTDMLRIARENGWLSIMAKTHFCHRPRKGGSPCGKCNPCRIAWEQGMEFRFPLKLRMKRRFKSLIAS